jgi:hypothetical protein
MSYVKHINSSNKAKVMNTKNTFDQSLSKYETVERSQWHLRVLFVRIHLIFYFMWNRYLRTTIQSQRHQSNQLQDSIEASLSSFTQFIVFYNITKSCFISRYSNTFAHIYPVKTFSPTRHLVRLDTQNHESQKRDSWFWVYGQTFLYWVRILSTRFTNQNTNHHHIQFVVTLGTGSGSGGGPPYF